MILHKQCKLWQFHDKQISWESFFIGMASGMPHFTEMDASPDSKVYGANMWPTWGR